VLLAPHGKTTMAPQLFARQLEAGAWGITLATMQQASLAVALGLRRLILANQLVGREDIAQARELVATVADLELYVLVDSLAGVALLEAHGAPAMRTRRSTCCSRWEGRAGAPVAATPTTRCASRGPLPRARQCGSPASSASKAWT
jgi:hypothetical protein